MKKITKEFYLLWLGTWAAMVVLLVINHIDIQSALVGLLGGR